MSLVLATLLGLFSLDAAYGQMGGPKPPFGPGGPGNNPTGNNPFEHSYRCSKCGATFTSSAIGGPGSCPNCGVKFINGGFETRGPGGPVGPGVSGGGASPVVGILILGVLFVGFLLFVGLIVLIVVLVNRRPAPIAARPRRRFCDDDGDGERYYGRSRR